MKLKEGQKVKSITFTDDTAFIVDQDMIKSMTISMEPGSVGLAPWVLVIGKASKNEPLLVNCEHLVSIQLINPD